MAVLINFKICDNAKECGGIEACPTNALSWDEKEKTILIDNSKCTSCGLCEPACEVSAIRVAQTDEEYERIKKEIDSDPRKVSDLFVDRYGAEPIDVAFIVRDGNFELEIIQSTKLTALELFNDDSIQCLLYSIPIKRLFERMDVKYRRIEADKSLLERFEIKELPSLLFFRDGKLIGKIVGYYKLSELEEMRKRVKEIVG